MSFRTRLTGLAIFLIFSGVLFSLVQTVELPPKEKGKNSDGVDEIIPTSVTPEIKRTSADSTFNKLLDESIEVDGISIPKHLLVSKVLLDERQTTDVRWKIPGVKVHRYSSTGLISSVFGQIDIPGAETPTQVVEKFLDLHASEFGLPPVDPYQALELISERPGLGKMILRYQQVYKGLPVRGSFMVFNVDQDLRLMSVGAKIFEITYDEDTTPILAEEKALPVALEALEQALQLPVQVEGPVKSELAIAVENGRPSSEWLISFQSNTPKIDWKVLIDSKSSRVKRISGNLGQKFEFIE
jgi:hypothetical protein